VIARVFQVCHLTRGLGLALFILASDGLADTLRVTTWNLQPAAVGSAPSGAPGEKEIRLPGMAAVLKKLAPDVILLQQVRDWKMCEALAQALKPANYSVLVCSAFPDARTGNAGQRQVAILARQRAYLSWSQPWGVEGAEGSPGGFAFAAIQTRGQRLGFFSVEPGDKSAFMRQLLGQVASVRNWVTNRVQIFVVGATLDNGSTDWPAAQPDTLRLFQGAGFADVFLEAPATERITLPRRAGQRAAQADYLFTQPPGCAINPHVLSNTVAEHYPVTCDLELDPARIAAAWAARSEVLSAREAPPANGTNYPLKPQPAAAQALPQPSTLNPQLIAVLVFAGIVALIAVVWALARRKPAPLPKTPRLLPADAGSAPGASSSYTVVVGTQSGTGPGSPPAAASSTPPPMIHIEVPGTTQTQAEMLRQRARAAEERAERATAAIRAGLIPHLRRWLKQKLLRKLMADREQMLETQQAATLKAMSVEARLAKAELQIQQQNHGYQQRIETLSRELIAAKEENRELIRAQIRQVKAEMEAARARLMAQAERDDRG
jgi:hypothetical protein